MTRIERAAVATAAALSVVVLALGIVGTDFWPPDEARVAEIAREMGASGDWVVPRFAGRPFLEEPPLLYWLQAAAFRLAGRPSTRAARLPSALAGVIGVLATGILARRLRVEPLIAMLVLATAPEYWWMARSATPDMAATAATTVALTAFVASWQTGSRAALAVTVLGLGAAFWLKGLLPVGLAVLAVAGLVAAAGPGRLSKRALAVAAAAAALLGAVWIVLLVRGVGMDGARFFLVTNHFGRLVGARAEGHVRPVWYYVANLALDLLPWSLVLPLAAAYAWRERRTPARLLALVWAAGMAGALSISASKRPHYLLPAYPALALLVAGWWMDGGAGRAERVVRRAVVVVVAVIAPALALLATSVRPDVAAIRSQAGRIGRMNATSLLQAAPPAPAAWALAAAVLVAGLVLVRLDRAHRAGAVAALLGIHAVLFESILTFAVLPRLNALSTARPLGERLGRLAAGDVRVVTFGASEDADLALGGVFFYAGRVFPGTYDPATLRRALAARGGCAVMRRQDYPALGDVHEATRVASGPLADSRLVVVEHPPGMCSAASADGTERP